MTVLLALNAYRSETTTADPLFSPEFLGRSLEKMKKFFQKDREPSGLGRRGDRRRGRRECRDFSETEESKARGNPIRKRCCSLHGPTWRKRPVFPQSLSTRNRPGNVL